MSAPALVVAAKHDRDTRSAGSVHALAAAIRRLRPDLPVEAGLLGSVEPDLSSALEGLVARGHTEIVVVPMLLSWTCSAAVEAPEVVARAAAGLAGVTVRAADVVGPDAALLSILDARLRAALRRARVRELDALVLAAAGTSDAREAAVVARLARAWGTRHRLPTSVAFDSTTPPSPGEAVRDWRRQGRRSVAVGSLTLSPGMLSDRVGELALEAGAVAVSAPLGASDELGRIVLARYCVGALRLVEISV